MKAKRRSRKKQDLSSLPYTVEEIRMKLRMRTGLPTKCAQKPDDPYRSKKIGMWDIALLARCDKHNLLHWIQGKRPGGLRFMTRLCRVLNLVNGGYVTKSQHGVYHFHDEPAVAPVREMCVNLSIGRITGEIRRPAPVKKMPSFQNLFGS